MLQQFFLPGLSPEHVERLPFLTVSFTVFCATFLACRVVCHLRNITFTCGKQLCWIPEKVGPMCFSRCLVIGPNWWKHWHQQSVISDCIIWYNVLQERVGLYWITLSIRLSCTHAHIVLTFKYQSKVNASPARWIKWLLTSSWLARKAFTTFPIMTI